MATSVSKTSKTITFSQKHPGNKLFLQDFKINNNHQGRSKKGKAVSCILCEIYLEWFRHFLYLIPFVFK